MMNTTEATETREVTVKELVAAFKGKYINVSPMDHYGISIEIHKGTIEFEDDLKPELYLVSRDSEDNVTGSICIDEDSIESIEKYDGTYTINFAFCMTSVDISDYRTVEGIKK
ncbi:hypothetical protein [Sporofaciens musculi]|uniref:hypothetical protein n=1 Tax=Sporofaciens musculi TaxID=2681861 RepID=UPI0025A27722|nr:hypothetical protein [Sporofaciens musculi]